MGKGIAYAFAIGGFEVHVNDINEDALAKAKNDIESLLEGSFEKGFLKEDVYKTAKENLKYETDLEKAAGEADLVVEAVLEKMEVKIDVFQKLDNICGSETILATNTSTMSPTEIGAQTSRPDKVVAMHFFNPVHKMKLIEVIRGLETSDETVATIENVGEQIGKEIVVVNEFPGFVTSRISALVGNEAFYMLQEGVGSPEEIDKAIKQIGRAHV